MNLQLTGGFNDPAPQSARAFRAVMEAMARPGRIETIDPIEAPAPLSPAAAVLLLTLTDPTTPLHLAGDHDCPAIRQWVAFHTGAPIVSAEEASFALGQWEALQPLDRFKLGEPSYPDRSATLIVERPLLVNEGVSFTGPGIAVKQSLNLPETTELIENTKLYPLGFDTIFTCGNRLAALPRTTKIEAP